MVAPSVGGAGSWYQPHPYGVLPLGNQQQQQPAEAPAPTAAAVSKEGRQRGAAGKAAKPPPTSRYGTLMPVFTPSAASATPITEQLLLDLLCDLVACLPVEDVCRLAAVCSGVYIYLHCSDAWKQVCTLLSPGRLVFRGSWRESAVRARMQQLHLRCEEGAGGTKGNADGSGGNGTGSVAGQQQTTCGGRAKKSRGSIGTSASNCKAHHRQPLAATHVPLRIARDRAVYNDTLFQSWLCTILPTTYKLTAPPGLRSRLPPVAELTMPAADATSSGASLEQQLDALESKNMPAVIRGGATGWPLFQLLAGDFQNLWRKEHLIFGENAVRKEAAAAAAPPRDRVSVASPSSKTSTEKEKQAEEEEADALLFRCEHTRMTVRDYCRYSHDQRDERPIYLFDAEFREPHPGAMQPGLYEAPPFFARDDFFHVLGPQRPKFRWLIAGPKRGGSSFHVDPNYTNAWNACLTGKKRWIMFPPGCVPCGIYPTPDMANVTAPLSLAEWLLNHYDASVAKYQSEGREVIAHAGDIVFVPCGWWHFVVNLADSVAITQNYVARHNLAKVLLFLQKLPNSISGIGEDEPEAEGDSAHRRKTIASAFESAMQQRFPAVLTTAVETHAAAVAAQELLRGGGGRKRVRQDDDADADAQRVDGGNTVTEEGFFFSFGGLQ